MFGKQLGTEEEPFLPFEAKIHRVAKWLEPAALSEEGGIVLTVCDEALFACLPLCASDMGTELGRRPPAVPPALSSGPVASHLFSQRSKPSTLRKESSTLAAMSNGSTLLLTGPTVL